MRLEAAGLTCVRGGREVFAGHWLFAVTAGEALVVTRAPMARATSSLLRMIAGFAPY